MKMGKKSFITKTEHEKCKKIAHAFSELYELTDIVVVDAGKYGFVKLEYYEPPRGFDTVITYTDSQSMFDDLWTDWLYEQILTPVLGTPIADFDYDQIFECLSKEKQNEIMSKKMYFERLSKLKAKENPC